MLSQRSLPVIRATLPVVAESINDITRVFYTEMFAEHPELLRDLFNRGNQVNGEQQKALAGSIAAFASMIVEHPDRRPDAMLSRIAHKHASLGITPGQYKIVHKHLLAAIVIVLHEAVTEEVAAAWDEVYWLMANALIAIESHLYLDAGVTDGEVWRQMRIVERRDDTPDVGSFALEPVDGGPAGRFRPGQYVSVRVPMPDGAHQIRQYSLTNKPSDPLWRISVKRVDGGAHPDGEVSSNLCEHAAVGDVLTVSAPFGDLVVPPHGDRPLLLASAGIGITPMIAILDDLVAERSSRPVTVVHADRSRRLHAHRDDQQRYVDALPDASLHVWYEDDAHSTGRIDLSNVDVVDGVVVFLCGPLPFMRAVREDLLARGVAPRDIHYEVFGPDLWLSAS
ncbi:MAG TPA: hypothetical protein H9881_16315 [Candidatus Stackebrandtia excrementipullorum]|nr:hypothetical protein [Candidatus Stackebrandtia excrementipullorum]